MLHHKELHADWVPYQKHTRLFADQDIPLPSTFNDDYRTRSAQIKNHRLQVGPQQWELSFGFTILKTIPLKCGTCMMKQHTKR